MVSVQFSQGVELRDPSLSDMANVTIQLIDLAGEVRPRSGSGRLLRLPDPLESSDDAGDAD